MLTKMIRLPLLIGFLLLLIPTVSMANDEYVLLSPLGDMDSVSNDPSAFNTYFSSIYQIGVSLVLALAVAVLIFGGIQYMTTDSFTKKGEARDTITAAVVGILLAVGSYAILALIIGERSMEMDLGIEAFKPGTWAEAPETCSVRLVGNLWGTAVRPDTPFCDDLFGKRPGIFGKFVSIWKDSAGEIIDQFGEAGFVCKGRGLTPKPYSVVFQDCFDTVDILNPPQPPPPAGPQANICHAEVTMLITSSQMKQDTITYIVHFDSADENENYTISIKEFAYDPESGALTPANLSVVSEDISVAGSALKNPGVIGDVLLHNMSSFSETYPGVIRVSLKDSSGVEMHEDYLGIGVAPTTCSN